MRVIICYINNMIFKVRLSEIWSLDPISFNIKLFKTKVSIIDGRQFKMCLVLEEMAPILILKIKL